MRWGVRRSKSERAAASGKDKDNKGESPKPKKVVGKTKTEGKVSAEMSDVQLRKVINRMQMEQQYAALSRKPPGLAQKGAKFAASIAVNVARTQLTNLANDQASKQVQKALARRATTSLATGQAANLAKMAAKSTSFA